MSQPITSIISGLTGEDGKVTLKLTKDEYDMLIDSNSYDSITDTFTVDSNSSKSYVVNPVATNTVKFYVKNPDLTNSSGAIVRVRGVDYLTDFQGVLELQIKSGYTKYKVSQVEMSDKYGEVLVDGETIVEVALIGAFYDVVFIVKDAIGRKVAGATVSFNNSTSITDSEGTCEFLDVAIGEYIFIISKPDTHNDATGVLLVVNSDVTTNKTLDLSLFPRYSIGSSIPLVNSGLTNHLTTIITSSLQISNNAIVPTGSVYQDVVQIDSSYKNLQTRVTIPYSSVVLTTS